MRIIISICLCSFLFIVGGCQPDANQTAETDTIDTLDNTADQEDSTRFIREYMTVQKPKDSTEIAQMIFEHELFDFGTIKEGKTVSHVYQFTNKGNAPLLISDAIATCGCTVASWPKDSIPINGAGSVKVDFDSSNKSGQQSKSITLIANTWPIENRLTIEGVVE